MYKRQGIFSAAEGRPHIGQQNGKCCGFHAACRGAGRTAQQHQNHHLSLIHISGAVGHKQGLVVQHQLLVLGKVLIVGLCRGNGVGVGSQLVDDIKAGPVSYTHLDVYKRQPLAHFPLYFPKKY